MEDNCQCNTNSNCDCHDENKTPEDKVDDLKKAIEDLGYRVEETEEGEIRISNS